jgi:N-acetylmuramoyl-L-alanine amidase
VKADDPDYVSLTDMDTSPPDGPSGGPELSRRRLLHLAGTAGLAVATIAACSKMSAADPSPSPISSPTAPPSPTPGAVASPAPAPVVTPPTVNPPSNVVLCRDAWRALPPRPGGTPHTLNRMTIHHTAVVLGDNSNAPARLRQHQRYHQDSQGWIDIAYHMSVDRNGNIYQLRDPELVGDTATSYDPTGHFLVVCEGNFDEEEVTEEQLNGAALAFAWAAGQFNITTDTLAGHRDVSSDITCPGASLYTHVTSSDLRSRVDAILAAGPVNLQSICGPEASAIVADIESGLR